MIVEAFFADFGHLADEDGKLVMIGDDAPMTTKGEKGSPLHGKRRWPPPCKRLSRAE